MHAYEESHPWITFNLDLTNPDPRLWMWLGECRSKCEHIKGVPLEPETAQYLLRLFLAKGVQATTAIEGNTLSEQQVLDHIEGKDLELPASQEYLETEVENIVAACNEIWGHLSEGGDSDVTADRIKLYNLRVLEGLPPEDGVVPGEIRTGSAVVGSVYKGAPAGDCEFLVQRMCEWLNGPQFKTDEAEMRVPLAVLKAVMAHLYIAWIHPFGNGNGRTARLVEVQILSAAGIPKPAAHLLSNHYNQTRNEYYRQLALTSKQGAGSEHGFIRYAVQGFVEGLAAQLKMIRDQQWLVAWENHVHRAFENDKSPVARRQRNLVLALSKISTAVPKAQLMNLDAKLILGYQGLLSDRALTRDLKELEDMGLVVKEKAGYRARTETILAFLPQIAAEIENLSTPDEAPPADGHPLGETA